MKHFLVTIRKTDNKKSVLIVPAERQSDIAQVLKDNGLSGSIKPISMEEPLKRVVVTCGWGKDAHSWPTHKWNAITHHNTCPEHRGK